MIKYDTAIETTFPLIEILHFLKKFNLEFVDVREYFNNPGSFFIRFEGEALDVMNFLKKYKKIIGRK